MVYMFQTKKKKEVYFLDRAALTQNQVGRIPVISDYTWGPYEEQTEDMGGPTLDSSTLCLFDVDGTLTAHRQVERAASRHS